MFDSYQVHTNVLESTSKQSYYPIGMAGQGVTALRQVNLNT